MFDGVVGLELLSEPIDWNAGLVSGEMGRRRPRVGESAGSGTGEGESLLLPLPLGARSSGVNRPFVLRWKNKGDVAAVGVTVGVPERVPRVADAVELERHIADIKG